MTVKHIESSHISTVTMRGVVVVMVVLGWVVVVVLVVVVMITKMC